MPAIEALPKAINHVVGPKTPLQALLVATGNPDKIREYREAGMKALPGKSVPEIQSTDPREVAIQKAKDAWRVNNGPTLVEDTSFSIDGFLGGKTGPYAKDMLGTRADRAQICEILQKLSPDKQSAATFQVLLALYDGRDVHIRKGVTRGVIAKQLQGAPRFSFDDMFIPDEEVAAAKAEKREPRTYAQMTLDEKNKTSARARALQKLQKEPFKLGETVFELPEPFPIQTESIRKEALARHPDAIRFAFSTAATAHIKPNAELAVDNFRPFHRIESDNGAVWQYVLDPKSADQGLVILPSVDLKRDLDGKPTRLDVDSKGDPILYQMGPEHTRMALASRALEFIEMHNDQTHQLIRALRDGVIPQVDRPNARSRALEEMLGMYVQTGQDGSHHVIAPATMAVATSEIAYTREPSLEERRSRRKTRQNGLFIGTDYGPMSIIGLGGMPPTTGSKDMLVLSAMGYGQCWIPRNGVYADNPERQLNLFREAKEQIQSFGLPKDIEKVCISRIGLSVGCEDPKAIADQVAKYYKEGGRSARIYTTNPDERIIQTAEAIKKATDALRKKGDEKFLLAVGPITDARQAKELKEKADIGMVIIGHGAGENCTSLEGGGAANAIPIAYELSLDPTFNKTLLFLEGGVGQNYGPLLGMVDGFSMNKKALGGIESTGGLYALHSDGNPAFPYHGSASPGTQLIEAFLNENVAARRLTDAGALETNEGKPNYFIKPDVVRSSADAIRRQREVIARAIADQQADSILELRQVIAARGARDVENGLNIIRVTPAAGSVARSHR